MSQVAGRRTARTLAAWEYRGAVRARWVLVMAGVFGLLCVAVTLLGFRSVRDLGLSGIGPASASLVNLGVLLPSLMGLVLGAGVIVGAREQGMLAMLGAQPIHRGAIVTGAFTGITGALFSTLGLGFGLALLLMSGVARAEDLPALTALIGATAGVAAASVAIGTYASTLASTRAQAITAAVGFWIVAALGVDLALAALAPSLHLGPAGLLAVVLLDPLEAGRILALLGANMQGTALGPFGAYLVTTFGPVGTIVLLAADLAAWTLVPVLLARRRVSTRDL